MNLKKPKISIIIPIYNCDKVLLRKSLSNIYKQSLKDIEIICVNDGSTDDSLNFLEKCKNKDKRIRIIDKKNEGTAFARKVGLNNANGEFILFMDQDDYLSNELEDLYFHAKKNESDLVFFDACYHNQSNSSTSFINDLSLCFPKNTDFNAKVFKYSEIRPHVLTKNFAPWFKLYKNSFLKKYDDLFFPKNFIYHDIGLHVQVILRAEKISYYPKVVYNYCLGLENQTTNKLSVNRLHNLEGLIVIDHVYNYLKENMIFNDFQTDFLYISLRVFKQRFEVVDDDEFKEELFRLIKKMIEKMNLDSMNINLIKNINFPNDDLIEFYKLIINSNSIYEYKLNEYINKTDNKLKIITSEIEKNNEKIAKLNACIDQYKNHLEEMGRELEYLNKPNRSFFQKFISKYPSLYILFNINKTGFRNTYIYLKGLQKIKKYDLFDIDYYLKNNSDVKFSGMDPLLHYMYHGYHEGRNPNSKFSGDNYLKKYPDVKKSKLNPLVHYCLYGIKERRTSKNQLKNPKIHHNMQDNQKFNKRIFITGASRPLLLYLLMFGYHKKDVFIVNPAIPPKIRRKMNAIFFPICTTKKMLRNNVLKLRFKIFLKTLFKRTEIYGNDHLPHSFPFYENKNTYLLEDGIGNYQLHKFPLQKDKKNITKYEKFKKRFLYGDYNQSMRFGRGYDVNKIYLTNMAKIPEGIESKVEILDIKRLWDEKSENEKKQILDIYSIDKKSFAMIDENTIIFLTQPYSENKILTIDEEINLYREILTKYDSYDIVIKPHPREEKDYSQYLSEYSVINGDFPIEFFILLDVKFKKIVTIGSAGALNFDENKIEFLGMGIHPKLAKLGEIT